MTRVPAPLRTAIAAFPGSRIREVSESAFGRPGIIPLWFGESDRETPGFIRDACGRALAEGKTFYTPGRGIPELRQALAEYLTKLHGPQVAVDRITVAASGVSAIMMVMETLVDPGDNVVLAVPLWPNCADSIAMLGAEPRRVALRPNHVGWVLDLDQLFDACDHRTRALFLNSPGNPTGWMMPAEQIAEVLAFCRRKQIWLITDEVYDRIVYGRNTAPSVLDIAGPDDPVIAINSFSKSWCMTGWRLGWVVAPPGYGEALAKVQEFNTSGANTMAQHAGIAALKQGEPFIKEIVEQYGRARDLVVQRLGGMARVRLVRPEAAFYAFFQVDGMNDSLSFAKRLVAETKVGLAPGIAFGPEGEGWLRLCFAASLGKLSEALDRLAPNLS
ncbi:MAG: pyridoxal phosphate-dependent aminotransferase [Proteobacteria bacterium]|nr:pyridoxal phosphate-dependent aminotransferase [Pseudomonadota bacterium]